VLISFERKFQDETGDPYQIVPRSELQQANLNRSFEANKFISDQPNHRMSLGLAMLVAKPEP
jgi:hypothetical protein